MDKFDKLSGLEGFNPDKVRAAVTEREKRCERAFAMTTVDAYNFFEKGGRITYNIRTPAEDGGVWVRIGACNIKVIDILSDVALAAMFQDDFDHYDERMANAKCVP